MPRAFRKPNNRERLYVVLTRFQVGLPLSMVPLIGPECVRRGWQSRVGPCLPLDPRIQRQVCTPGPHVAPGTESWRWWSANVLSRLPPAHPGASAASWIGPHPLKEQSACHLGRQKIPSRTAAHSHLVPASRKIHRNQWRQVRV